MSPFSRFVSKKFSSSKQLRIICSRDASALTVRPENNSVTATTNTALIRNSAGLGFSIFKAPLRDCSDDISILAGRGLASPKQSVNSYSTPTRLE